MGDEATPGMRRFAEVLAMAGGAVPPTIVPLHADDAINIQFTSAPPAPKGATLTHRNIVNNGDQVTACMRLTATRPLCIPVPLYHCFGMVLGTCWLRVQGQRRWCSRRGLRPARHAGGHRRRSAAPALHGVPTMFIAELDHPDFNRFDLSSLRTGIMAGAPCPIEVMKKVQAR
jgi:fatty-acyl-CoA synthase